LGCRQVGRQAVRQASLQTGREPGRQGARQADRQTRRIAASVRLYYNKYFFLTRQWKKIKHQQSGRWQHLSGLKANAYFCLQKN